MRELAEKLRNVEREIATERGPFLLFALILRERSSDRWDLVVSAYWIPTRQRETLDYIAKKLSSALSGAEVTRISRIVILDAVDPFVLTVQGAISVEHNLSEFRGCKFNEIEIDHAYIITSRRGTGNSP